MEINYRSELKYIITNNDFNLLKYRLESLLKKDKNVIDGSYKITTIYFDNMYRTSYYQVLDGISQRWKYRIRFYNNNDEYIVLEKKYKINSRTNKTSIRITKQELDKIMKNEIEVSLENHKLFNEFIIKLKTEMMRPIILVEYDRIPFVYDVGNIRITLDYNIGFSKEFDKAFTQDKNLIYLKERILEVKFNDLIPEHIRAKLELNHLERTSYSKFKNCIEGNI